MLGTLNEEKPEELLAAGMHGRIGCNADGITYVVPSIMPMNRLLFMRIPPMG